MSTSTAIALIITSMLLGVICFLGASKLANEVTDETVTGVIRGIPIPSRFREIRFYANFTPYALCSAVSSLFVAFVNASIARHAVDTDVKALAYAAVVIGAVAGIGWLLQAASDLLYVRSVLRETRRDVSPSTLGQTKQC